MALLKTRQIFIGVVHGDCEEDALYLAQLIRQEFGYDNILIQPVGSEYRPHISGPGAIGVLFFGRSPLRLLTGTGVDFMCTFKNYKILFQILSPEVFNIPEYINQKPVEEIGPRAFYGCRGLRRIVVPKTVRRISSYAFAECRELESFVFPWRLNTVDDYAFLQLYGAPQNYLWPGGSFHRLRRL